jgi:hypothetical protein
VAAVTEIDRSHSWLERKTAALEKIQDFTHDALMLKSADVISNMSEIITDFEIEGDTTFERFSSNKDKMLAHAEHVIESILLEWSENPLADDLRHLHGQLVHVAGTTT